MKVPTQRPLGALKIVRDFVIFFSNPSKVQFIQRGEIIPPWGIPAVMGLTVKLSCAKRGVLNIIGNKYSKPFGIGMLLISQE
jgi:hypothetical protein